MKMYKWYFEGFDIKFISTEENMEKHILTQRQRLSQPDTKIIIESEYTDLNQSPTTGCASCNSNPTPDPQPTVSVGAKKTKTRSKAVELPGVHSDVDDVDPAANVLEDDIDLELLNGVNDRLAL
jgi:hypothetical protein